MQVTRIILVDDHNLFRAGLKALLATEADLTVVAEAATAHDGLEAVRRFLCDVVVIDFNLPDEDGHWLSARLRQRHPAMPILVLSQHEDVERVRLVMANGCNGYLVKTASEQELISAIRTVAAGGIYVHQSVARAVLGTPDTSRDLSPREAGLLRLLSKGKSNQEIAVNLNVSLGTVKRELTGLYERFSVSDRTRLVAEAVARGLVDPRSAT